jgi:hypothetical protein
MPGTGGAGTAGWEHLNAHKKGGGTEDWGRAAECNASFNNGPSPRLLHASQPHAVLSVQLQKTPIECQGLPPALPLRGGPDRLGSARLFPTKPRKPMQAACLATPGLPMLPFLAAAAWHTPTSSASCGFSSMRPSWTTTWSHVSSSPECVPAASSLARMASALACASRVTRCTGSGSRMARSSMSAVQTSYVKPCCAASSSIRPAVWNVGRYDLQSERPCSGDPVTFVAKAAEAGEHNTVEFVQRPGPQSPLLPIGDSKVSSLRRILRNSLRVCTQLTPP